MNASAQVPAVSLPAAPATPRWAFAALPAGALAANAELWADGGVGGRDVAALCTAAAAAGCALVQVSPPALAAAVAGLRATTIRVAARIAGPAALVSTQLFDAGECLRLGADEIAWPLPVAAAREDPALAAALAAAAAGCRRAGARLKLIAVSAPPGLQAWARQCGIDTLALTSPVAAAPAGAIARILDL